VPNSLYDLPSTLLLFGDAKATVTELLQGLPTGAGVEAEEVVA